jgi:hypothetical protein
MDGLSIFALILLILVFLVIAYGLIIIHDIPYHMAVKRNHPHQDAIHVAGWISLFTLHAIWPFLWIWATLYRPERGYGFKIDNENELRERLSAIETKLAELGNTGSSTTQE